MTRGDNHILEFLHEKEIVATPKVIALNIDFTRQYVNERIARLAAAGLLDRIQRGVYQISDLGERYLIGDLTDEEEERLREFFGD